MIGGGNSQSINKVVKSNKKLLRKTTIFQNRRSYTQIKASYKAKSKGRKLKQLTRQELLEIRTQLKEEARKRFYITMVIVFCSSAFVTFASYSLLAGHYGRPLTEKVDLEAQKQKKIEEFDVYILEGDQWIAKKNWKNAIYQYENATKVFPNNFDARYRVALAYTYQCQYDNIDCVKAKLKVVELREQMPNNQNILTLEKILLDQ